MEILSYIFYFVVIILILVVVHEWGHFITARMTGMRADVFAIGMGRRLFGWNKKLGFTFGQLPADYEYDGTTDWRVCMFPIGGYVKIPGMIDESMDESYVESEAKPYEFRSKNTFQKALVLSAGVIMNFILAVVIFAGIKYFTGDYKSLTTQIAYVYKDSFADKIGLKSNDKIVKINNQKITNWEDMLFALSLDNFGNNLNIQVKREDKTENINIGKEKITKLITNNEKMEAGINHALGIDPADCGVVVTEVISLEPAGKAGIQKNDTLLNINSDIVTSSSQLSELIKSNSGVITVRIKRGSRIINTFVTPEEETHRIGVYTKTIYLGEKLKTEYDLIESTKYGIKQSAELVNLIFTSFSEIFKGNIKFESAVGGPIMIAKQSAKTAEMGLVSFLVFIANLSISLALINILPIPALDGGHLIIVLIEGIIRRELPTKAKIIIQNIGMVLLFAFLIFVIYKDILR